MAKTELFVRKQPGGMFAVVREDLHPGELWFVSSEIGTDAVGYGRNPDAPFATIDYAVGQATANNGDVIYVLPGHTETISAAAGLDLDVAGIKIIGVGHGNERPHLKLQTATTADIDVDAADILVRNFRVSVDIDSLAVIFDVNAKRFALEDVEFAETSAKQWLTAIDINGGAANACDGAAIRRCKAAQASAGADRFVELGEVADEVTIEDCRIDGDFSDAGIHNPTGKVLTNLRLHRNCVRNRQTGDHAIELVSACTGEAIDNRLFGDTLGTIFDPGSLFCAGNLESAAIDVPGVPTPLAVQDGSANLIGADNSNNAAGTTNVAANEDGSILERLEQIQEATNKGTGTAAAANKSVLDALGFDGGAAIAATAGMLRTMAGTVFVVKKTLTSSAVVQAGVDVTGVSSVGDIQIIDVLLQCDGTGLATGTAFTLEANNTRGSAVFLSTAVSGLGANAVMDLDSASTTSKTVVLESGKKIVAKSTVADCTGAGTVDVYLICRRLADNATLAAA